MTDQENSPRRQRRRLAWLAGLGGLAILAGTIYAISPRWLMQFVGNDQPVTDAILRVEPARSPLFGGNIASQSGRSAATDTYFRSQMHLINSKKVRDKALNDPQVSDRPIVRRQTDAMAWLSGALRVEQIPDTFLIRVTMEDGDPDDAYEMLSAVIRAYMEEDKQYSQSIMIMHIRSLKEQSSKLEREIGSASERLREIGQKSCLNEADAGRRGEHRQFLRQELVRTKLKILAEKARSPSMELQKAQAAAKGEALPTDPLKVLEAQLKVLEAELSRAADGERESLLLAKKIERLDSLNLSIDNLLREATWQAETGHSRVTIADGPYRINKQPWEKESLQGEPGQRRP